MTTSAPNYARHTKKAEWGLGLLLENDGTHFRYIFQDGEFRAFASAGLGFLRETTPNAEEKAALEALRTGKKRPGDKKKKKAAISEELRGGPDSTRKPVHQAPVVASLAQQLEIFARSYPKGFDDEHFIDRERGGHGSRKVGRQGIVDLAKTSLTKEALQELLLKSKGDGIATLCKKVLAKGKTLLSLEELESFNLHAKSTSSEQRFGEALFDMLHGQGPLGHRLEALSTALPPDLRTWRLSTFFGAFYDPTRLLFVDPDVTFRQSHIMGVVVSFQSAISGAMYEQLSAMSLKLFDELKAKGLTPRDLLDVHLFTSHTLHPDSKKRK